LFGAAGYRRIMSKKPTSMRLKKTLRDCKTYSKEEKNEKKELPRKTTRIGNCFLLSISIRRPAGMPNTSSKECYKKRLKENVRRIEGTGLVLQKHEREKREVEIQES